MLDIVAQQRPDVLLLDLSMPHFNGVDTAQRLHETAPELKIIVVSMHSDEAYVLRALKAGVCGYVLKQSSETAYQQAKSDVESRVAELEKSVKAIEAKFKAAQAAR